MLPKKQLLLAAEVLVKFEHHIDLEKIRLFAYQKQDVRWRQQSHEETLQMILDDKITLKFKDETDDPILELTEKGIHEAEEQE